MSKLAASWVDFRNADFEAFVSWLLCRKRMNWRRLPRLPHSIHRLPCRSFDRHLYCDQMSGGRADRPGLKAALAACRSGDTLVVWRLDRLGRSVRDLSNIVRDLMDRGVGFRSLTEAVDTMTTAGRLLMHVLAAVSEAERSMASDRIRAGMAARRTRGVHIGRLPALSVEQISLARQLYEDGQSLKQISRTVRGRDGKHPAASTVWLHVHRLGELPSGEGKI